jgi:4-hydroxybenzoate polyprenyltransferase
MRVPWSVFVVAGVGVGLGLPALVVGVVVIGAAGGAPAALNDRADVASDRANGRFDRPLVSGLLSDRDVIGVVVGAGLAALAVQPVLPQPTGLAVTVLALVVGAASACEPVALQRRGLVGLLALGLCYLVLPVALAAGWAPALHAIPLAAVGAGVLAHKDARDERGDRLAGKATLVVRVGSRPMARIAFAATMVGVAGLAVSCASAGGSCPRSWWRWRWDAWPGPATIPSGGCGPGWRWWPWPWWWPWGWRARDPRRLATSSASAGLAAAATSSARLGAPAPAAGHRAGGGGGDRVRAGGPAPHLLLRVHRLR